MEPANDPSQTVLDYQPSKRLVRKETLVAAGWGLAVAGLLAVGIVFGSRTLEHFDAALVAYTFATLFASFGITYRYAIWLQRPPTAMYWKRGWQVFLSPRFLAGNIIKWFQKVGSKFAMNLFIFKRGKARWGAHLLIMWGCIIAAAITFPLVFGWVHFETEHGDFEYYRVYVMGFATDRFRIESLKGFLIFHGLVWSAILVIIGVMLAMYRRMRDHGAAAVQQFGEDFLPLIMLFAISVTGLMLTASYTWMKGYGYDFIAILHAVTVIFTLLWLPFGKFFHIFQRPAQLGVAFYKDVGAKTEQCKCERCGEAFASLMHVNDLITVERQLGFDYELPAEAGKPASHYQKICPKCRRALLALAQGRLRKTDRPSELFWQ
jgi:hypothetical protein